MHIHVMYTTAITLSSCTICASALAGITRCLQEHGWVDETPYEVMGVTVGESVVRTEAPRKGRENAINKVRVRSQGLRDHCDAPLSKHGQSFLNSPVFPVNQLCC